MPNGIRVKFHTGGSGRARGRKAWFSGTLRDINHSMEGRVDGAFQVAYDDGTTHWETLGTRTAYKWLAPTAATNASATATRGDAGDDDRPSTPSDPTWYRNVRLRLRSATVAEPGAAAPAPPSHVSMHATAIEHGPAKEARHTPRTSV